MVPFGDEPTGLAGRAAEHSLSSSVKKPLNAVFAEI